MKTLLTILIFFFCLASTAQAENWSCAFINQYKKPIVFVFKRVDDHFELNGRSDLKYKILHESRLVLALTHIDARENQEVFGWNTLVIDKITGRGKSTWGFLWTDKHDSFGENKCKRS